MHENDAEIAKLRLANETLRATNARLTEAINALREATESLQAELACLKGPEPTAADFYDFNAFMFMLMRMRGTHYGGPTAYVRASHHAGCRPVTTNEMTGMKKKGRVPCWVVEQLSAMHFEPTKASEKHEWSNQDAAYLRALIEGGEHRLPQLAEMCSERFGRQVTMNAVRSQITRMHLWQRPRTPMEAILQAA